MFQSVRRYALEAGIENPVVCYQGAVVADPVGGHWLRHVPIPLELAREAIAALEGRGLLAELLRRRRAVRRRGDARSKALRRLPAPRAPRGGQPARVARPAADEAGRHRRPRGARRSEAADARTLRGPALHLQVAAVLPRVRLAQGDKGCRARLSRRAARVQSRADGRVRRRRERHRARRLGGLRRSRRERRRTREGGRRLHLPVGRRRRGGSGARGLPRLPP